MSDSTPPPDDREAAPSPYEDLNGPDEQDDDLDPSPDAEDGEEPIGPADGVSKDAAG